MSKNPEEENRDHFLRVLTYNIHKGVCFYSRQQVLAKIKSLVREVNADLVFLQEIRGKGEVGLNGLEEASHFESQLEFLADSVWSHFAYGKNSVYERGNHGNAILSRFPIRDWTNIDISTNVLEKRGLLHILVDHPRVGDLHLVCLHLNLLSKGRKFQLHRLIERISQQVPRGPLIVAGDFNDWQKEASEQISGPLQLREAFLELHGGYARTFPSFNPQLCLDRVYFRDLTLQSGKVFSGPPWNRLSDHVALVVDFKMN